MIIECIDDVGFEDALNIGGQYEVKIARNNSYLIEDDKGIERWFGQSKFILAFVV